MVVVVRDRHQSSRAVSNSYIASLSQSLSQKILVMKSVFKLPALCRVERQTLALSINQKAKMSGDE